MPFGKRKTSRPSAASNVCQDTLGLHSVSDDSRRAIFNSTCKALGMPSEQVEFSKWRKIAKGVLPEVFYPLELTAVEEGKKVVFYIASVAKVLQTAIHRCPSYAALVENTAKKLGGKEFELLLYNDEASGGNILAPDSSKKASLWYFALRQAQWLWSPVVWHPLCLFQHSQFEKIQGGFSAAFRGIVHALLEQGLHAGFPVKCPTGLVLLRCKLGHMLSDLDSIRYALDAKGAAAIRCCWLCKNCIKRDSGIPDFNMFFKKFPTPTYLGSTHKTMLIYSLSSTI